MDTIELISSSLSSTQAADAAKAYLRSVLAVDLLKKLPSSAVPARTDGESELCDALCAAHLGTRGFKFTLSVLAAEAPAAVTPASNSSARLAVELRCRQLSSQVTEESVVASPLERLFKATGEDATKRMNELTGSLLSVATNAEKATAEMAAASASLQTQAESQIVKSNELMSTEKVSRGSSLHSKLAAIDKQHSDFSALQRELAAEKKGSTAVATLASIRSEMRSQFDAELASAVASARADEADRVRSEERIKFESALATQKALFDSLRAQESLILESSDESLRKARDEASRGAHELRQRLAQDIDTVSVRESQLRRAHQLELRALQIENDRRDDELRRMSLRIREADEAARSAETRYKLQFERWRNEYILRLEARESEIVRGEAAFTRQLAELQAERRTLGVSASKLPALEIELETAQKERDKLKSLLAHESEKASIATRQRDEYMLLLSDEKSRSQRALDKVEAAESIAALYKSRHDGFIAETTNQRNEWNSAVKMLRNRLSEASARLSLQDEKISQANDEWEDRLHATLEEERMRFDDAQRLWMAERAKLISERDSLSVTADLEARRADEAHASLSGANLRLNELDKSIAVMRASTSSSVASVAGGSGRMHTNASSSERSSPNASFVASFHNVNVPSASKQTYTSRQRRFSANPVLMHALEVFNNAGDPLQPPSSNAIEIGDPILLSSSNHEKKQNERRDIVETAVAAAIATLNHQNSTHPVNTITSANVQANMQKDSPGVSVLSASAISARPPLPPQNPSTSKNIEFHSTSKAQSPSASLPFREDEEKDFQGAPLMEELRKQHSPAGEAAAEAASALLSETFGGHQQDWGQTIFSEALQDDGNILDIEEVVNQEGGGESAIQTEMVEEESLSGDFY